MFLFLTYMGDMTQLGIKSSNITITPELLHDNKFSDVVMSGIRFVLFVRIQISNYVKCLSSVT